MLNLYLCLFLTKSNLHHHTNEHKFTFSWTKVNDLLFSFEMILFQIVQSFDNLNVNNNTQYVSQQPIVQQPTTPQYNVQQQWSFTSQHQHQHQHQHQPVPSNIQQHHQQQQPVQEMSSGSRRTQVARGLQYKDSSFDASRPSPAVVGLGMDNFRLLSVLGRGHFGKVILSQYINTGEIHYIQNATKKTIN